MMDDRTRRRLEELRSLFRSASLPSTESERTAFHPDLQFDDSEPALAFDDTDFDLNRVDTDSDEVCYA
jgi:hypothetical protein